MRCNALTLAIVALTAMASSARALTFDEAYRAARSFDAKLQAAGYERDVAKEAVGVARAGLRPTVTATMSESQVTGVRTFSNASSQEVRVRTDYFAPQASLSMRAPIINLEASSNLRRVEAQAVGADAIWRVRSVEMVERLGMAFLDVLLARENMVLADNQVIALQGQLTRAEQRLKRGEGTRTDIAQAQSALELARVKVLEAADQMALARHSMRRVAGLDVSLQTPSASTIDFEPPALVPAEASDWLELALRNNPLILAGKQSIEAARFAVQGRRAGHYPRLDIVASASRSQNDSISSLNQSSRLNSVGFQLTLPLYSGGGVDASVRQSAAELQRIEEEVRSDREGVELDVQRSHRTLISGASKIAAQRNALRASEVVLEGIGKALAAGLATAVDVLDAQSRVYLAARDLAQSRYDYLLARLRLLAQAGTPAMEVVQDIDRLLATSPLAAPTTRTAP
jgi:protease secretion system outer membrane protein